LSRLSNGKIDSRAHLSDIGAISSVMEQMINRMNTAIPVKVVAVTNNGGIEPVGYVDVLPSINQIDGDGKSLVPEVIHNLPYFRLQGGANACIIDPEVGDKGLACFCSSDISTFKTTGGQSNPGSYRKFDMSDGIYFGGVRNAAPTQYIQFNASGITIHSPSLVNLDGGSGSVKGVVQGDCICPYTRRAHIMISSNVKSSK